MKNKVLLLIGLIETLMFLGCQQQSNSSGSSEGRLYYVEGCEMGMSDFISIIEPYKSKYSTSDDLTFEEIKAIRNKCRECKKYSFSSDSDVLRKDLTSFYTSHGCTPSEAEERMEVLDERGNALEVFNTYNSEHVIYLYIEKVE